LADADLSRLTDVKAKDKRMTTAFAANQDLMYEVTDYVRHMGQFNPNQNNVARYQAIRWTIGELAIRAAV
jgi:hypothetical protein